MRDAAVRWVGRVAAGAAVALLMVGAAVYPGNVGGVPEFRGVIIAGNLAVAACGAAGLAALCYFAATPSGRRRRPVVLEVRRLLGHAGCAACLSLSAGVCVLWAASHRQGFGAIYYNGDGVDYAVGSRWNLLTFGTEPRWPGNKGRLGAGDMNLGTPFPLRRVLRVPHAVVAVGFALPAVAWIVRRRRANAAERRREAGLCPACGYDLRASAGRCPECGTVPAGGAGA